MFAPQILGLEKFQEVFILWLEVTNLLTLVQKMPLIA